MPRPPRIIVPEWCYHFINRANQKAKIFHEPSDYDAFVQLIGEAQSRVEVPIHSYCLMPNHVHFVVQPHSGEKLNQWAHWLFTSHAHRYHARHDSSGHVWQGRFKTFAIQGDHHLRTVMRYVERNALTANLVERAEDWRWGSLRWRTREAKPLELAECPIELPSYWVDYVNDPQTAVELAEIRTCVNRQRPFGSKEWVSAATERLQNEQSLDPLGRPRKRKPGTVS